MKVFSLVFMSILGFSVFGCEASCGDYDKVLRRNMMEATAPLDKWSNGSNFDVLPDVINKISLVKKNTEECIGFYRQDQTNRSKSAQEFYRLSVLLTKIEKIKSTVEQLMQKNSGKKDIRTEMQLIPLVTEDFWRKYQEFYPDSN